MLPSDEDDCQLELYLANNDFFTFLQADCEVSEASTTNENPWQNGFRADMPCAMLESNYHEESDVVVFQASLVVPVGRDDFFQTTLYYSLGFDEARHFGEVKK